MDTKNTKVTFDLESGITQIPLKQGDIAQTISLSDEGCEYLDSIGADVILDFDKDGKLLNLELMGL